MTLSTDGSLRVAEIWRYPVKSLRGEMLNGTWLSNGGSPATGSCTFAGYEGC